MANNVAEPCRQRALIEVFARDELDGDLRREAERELEQSEPCRELFRKLTAGRYPRLENYTIIGQIGKGGFGVVYKAIHHAKERVEALKVLFSKTPLLTSYFQNEVHLIARLQHPNIATLYDAQLTTPPLYYTMEFVEGRRLNDYLRQEEVSLATRIDLIKLVAQAVGYAHGEGVVHRDLKPQNILIDGKGQPHIVDFGIAKKLAEVGATESDDQPRKGREGPVGTLGYIAPEQERGDVVDGRADIFALGALLFHCVTGEPARLAKLGDQRLKALRDRRVVQAEDLSAIIARCVEDAPDDRYASVDDFVADLDGYLTGRPIQARRTASLSYHASRLFSLVMREYALAVRVAALVMVAGFLTWLMWAIQLSRVTAGQEKNNVVLIGITNQTRDAIDAGDICADLPGVYAHNVSTWRPIYGQLFEKLSEAKPDAVVFDAALPDCRPLDEYLLSGIRALNAPLVVGVEKFDLNGEPEMCPAIRDAVHGYGVILARNASNYPNEYEITCAVRREFETIPGLSLAAFAATRYPDRNAVYDLDLEHKLIRIRYRVPNPKPGELKWQKQTDEVPFIGARTVRGDQETFREAVYRGWLWEGDLSIRAFVDARSNTYWRNEQRTLSVEEVLIADKAQLLDWFKGKVIVLGKMVPGEDEYERANGDKVFGCQVHAEAIDTFVSGWTPRRYERYELTTRNLFWCGIAMLFVSLLARSRWRSLNLVTGTCAAIFAVGVGVSIDQALSATSPVVVELLIAAAGLIGTGSVAYWITALRTRQLELSPSSAMPTVDGSTLPSTMLAETR